METMGTLRRTNYCGEVSLANAGQEMTVCGSIARARDKGGIIFADLRDTTGILQLVFDEDTPKDVFAKAESLKSEYVVICRGKLRERAAKTDKIATGDVELYVSELRILSEAQTTPFELRDEINVNDDLRLRYRYLDLRRPSMHEPIVLRSKIMQIIRNYFCENHFCEIETPTLIKSTPEGARDYLVPSRVQPGHFYALPQSPQLYKQILMLSGFDRYFQIARCYRDEDLRADRQPEFTQVDEEMSFVSEDDIMTINEGLIKRLWKEMLNIDVQTPFVRMPWDEAMGRFGSDKPDTRFGLEIQDVTEVFKGTEFKPFAAVLEAGGTIRAINAKGLADKLSRKNIDKLGEVAKTVSTGLTPRNIGGNEVFLRYVEVDDVLGCHISFDFLRESLDASRPETACVDFDFVVCTVIAGFHVVVDHIYEVASSLLVFGVSGRNGLQVFVLTDFQLRLFL